MPAWLAPAAISVGSTLLGGLFGNQQAEAQRRQFREQQALAREAAGFLSPEAIGGQFRGLQGLLQGDINAMVGGQVLAGQGAAQGIQGGLARAGLGNTGLGAALGAGVQAGAAFQGNQLRSRLLADLMGTAATTQAQRGQFLMGALPQGSTGVGAFGGALQGGAGALQVLGSLGWNPFGQGTQPTYQPGQGGPLYRQP